MKKGEYLDMGSYLSSIFTPVFANGLFTTLNTGGSNLRNEWDTVAKFGGAIVIIFAVVFLIVAVAKQRDKSRWYWSSAIAFIVGAVLLMAGSVNMIQGDFSDTWKEVFGMINLVSCFGLPGM